MTFDEMQLLQIGDKVRNKGSGRGYIIVESVWRDGVFPGFEFIGVRTQHILNETEWEKVE